MPTRYKCPTCGEIYNERPHDTYCREHYGVSLVPIVEVDVQLQAEAPAAQERHAKVRGLGVLVCDVSYSMNEPAFPEDSEASTQEKKLPKLKIVADAVESAILQMRTLSNKESAYVAIIAFGTNASVIKDRQDRPFIKSVQDILDDFGNGLGAHLLSQFEGVGTGVDRNRTNITSALQLAREIVDGAISGSLSRWGVKEEVSIFKQPVNRLEKKGSEAHRDPLEVHNVRVMIYSDGAHNEGILTNAFDTFQPTSILMTAFIGDEKANANAGTGADQMRSLANICPTHEDKGYFLINVLGRRAVLREVFHMATGASGFCPKCMIEGLVTFS